MAICPPSPRVSSSSDPPILKITSCQINRSNALMRSSFCARKS